MSGQSVPEDATTLSRLDRAYFRVETVMNLLAGLTVLSIMILAVVNILGRKLFNLPVPGFVDWMEQAVPIIAFLGIAYCQRLGGHIRMDILIGQLKGRALYAAEFVSVLAMLLLTLLLVRGSWLHFERSFDWNAPLWSRDSTIDINLPTWPVKLLVPIVLTLLAIRFVLQLWAYARAFRHPDRLPIAVPLIEDAATIAKKEAEAVSGAKVDAENEGAPR